MSRHQYRSVLDECLSIIKLMGLVHVLLTGSIVVIVARDNPVHASLPDNTYTKPPARFNSTRTYKRNHDNSAENGTAERHMPYVALVRVYDTELNGQGVVYAGTVLTKLHVLMLASCLFTGREDDPVEPGVIEVIAGAANQSAIKNTTGPETFDAKNPLVAFPMKRTVRSYHLHPGFDQHDTNKGNDFAVLVLSTELKFTIHVQSVTLPSSEKFNDVFTAGWQAIAFSNGSLHSGHYQVREGIRLTDTNCIKGDKYHVCDFRSTRVTAEGIMIGDAGAPVVATEGVVDYLQGVVSSLLTVDDGEIRGSFQSILPIIGWLYDVTECQDCFKRAITCFKCEGSLSGYCGTGFEKFAAKDASMEDKVTCSGKKRDLACWTMVWKIPHEMPKVTRGCLDFEADCDHVTSEKSTCRTVHNQEVCASCCNSRNLCNTDPPPGSAPVTEMFEVVNERMESSATTTSPQLLCLSFILVMRSHYPSVT